MQQGRAAEHALRNPISTPVERGIWGAQAIKGRAAQAAPYAAAGLGAYGAGKMLFGGRKEAEAKIIAKWKTQGVEVITFSKKELALQSPRLNN